MKYCYILLLVITSALVFILGKYLWTPSNISLKVILPLSCLILGLVICAVVVGCKTFFDMNQSDSATVVIIDEKEETGISER